jgi:S-(hydroxymethyl)glutathione dehydrogenase/alcohol dehydrogenase
MEVQGLRGNDKYLPHLLGHEGVGIVLKIGSGVTKVKEGDKVIIGWIKSSGIASEKPMFFDESNLMFNAGLATTFSDISVVSENRVYLQPEFLPDRIASLFGCAMLTGAGMVLNELTPRHDQSVLVLGLGGVGLSALLAILTINPVIIIAADVNSEKRKLARELGIKYVLDPSKPSFLEEVNEITDGGVDLSYECAGYSQTIEKAFSCLNATSGKLIFASHPKFGETLKIDPYELIQGKTIKGSWGGGAVPDLDVPKISKLFMKHSVVLEKMIGTDYKLAEINVALDDLATGKSIRPIIAMHI